jgi:AAA ATPase-like protein
VNPIENPFSPGAGTQPPELAGRADVLRDVGVTLQRVRQGASSRSAIFVGLRGVGKTVLLNRVAEMAQDLGFMTVFIEAHEDKSLPILLLPHLRQILIKLNSFERVSSAARRALMVFRSFASSFKAKITLNDIDIELGVEPEPGSADSGDLEHDLGQMLVAVAEAAKGQNTRICLLIDELQYLTQQEMSALIMGLHQVSQKNLPLIMYAAGLPLILGLAGRSKSYSERLFAFPRIGVLDELSARRAIELPALARGVSFEPQAIDGILKKTGRYPYFLQQWGYETWNTAESSPISLKDVVDATARAINQLDDSFFRVRFDRLTKREKDFLFAMVSVGGDQQRSGDIAEKLKVKATSIGPLRSSLIRKGMIYSPAHGDNAFTVPLFDDFLRRQQR